ncbi:unnamed protein product [Urochloa humidicola]
MGRHASSRGLTFCSRSPPHLGNNPPPLSKPATTMSPGGGRAGGAGRNKNPQPPQGVHPRYIPKRGAVLKGIARGVLRSFLLASPLATDEAGGGGAEQRASR